MKKIIVIVGPTGVGKTKLSVELAKRMNGIVINADSVQLYKGLDIGSAKPTEAEKENVPHYLFDTEEVTNNYTVSDYQIDVRKLFLEHKDDNIILVGGTGLYIKAALYDYKFLPQTSINYDHLTNEELYHNLLKINPNIKIDTHNRRRLINALNNNGKIADHHDKILYNFITIGLTTDRQELYKIIDKRVDKMINNGLIDEVKSYYDQDIKSKPLLTAIGYKELYQYFDHQITKEEAIDLIKKNSRHYAKRQYTWFNNQMNVNWLEVDFDNFSNTVNKALEIIKGGNNG